MQNSLKNNAELTELSNAELIENQGGGAIGNACHTIGNVIDSFRGDSSNWHLAGDVFNALGL